MWIKYLSLLPIIINVLAILVTCILRKTTDIEYFTTFLLGIIPIEILSVLLLWRRKKYEKVKESKNNIITTVICFLGINMVVSSCLPSSTGVELTSVLSLTYVILIGPLLEELIFRGICIDNLSDNIPKHIKCLFSAILFAIFHLNFQQGIVAFISGYLLAKIRIEKGILYSIITHILCNVVASFLGGDWRLIIKILFIVELILVITTELGKFKREDIKHLLSVNLVFSIVVFTVCSTLLLF